MAELVHVLLGQISQLHFALFAVVGLKWGRAGKTPFEMTLGGGVDVELLNSGYRIIKLMIVQ
ncbi:MAG TPA: hypothetical protein VLL52_08615 [Anaerolineae bacterium]|nr:hypothetical protein [Anaerolineae bacterium]